MHSTEHLDPLRTRVRDAVIAPPPRPWKDVDTWAIGGLTEIGFGPGTELLLVVSTQGRGVIDCHSGVKVARDPSGPVDDTYDPHRLMAKGIGPLDRQEIRIAGLHGGGLPNSTRDSWWATALPLDWPHHHLLLGGPRGWIYDNQTPFSKLAIESELRAFGFSDTGKTLVIATSSDVRIISRD